MVVLVSNGAGFGWAPRTADRHPNAHPLVLSLTDTDALDTVTNKPHHLLTFIADLLNAPPSRNRNRRPVASPRHVRD